MQLTWAAPGTVATAMSDPGSGQRRTDVPHGSHSESPCSAAGRGGERGSDQVGRPSRRGYLAQHELFDQIPALRRDIVEPDFCRLGSTGRAAANAWFGPPGTVSSGTGPRSTFLVGCVIILSFSRNCKSRSLPGRCCSACPVADLASIHT